MNPEGAKSTGERSDVSRPIHAPKAVQELAAHYAAIHHVIVGCMNVHFLNTQRPLSHRRTDVLPLAVVKQAGYI